MKPKKRPNLKLPFSSIDKILVLISILCVILSWGLLIALWDKIPDMVPTHFNFAGQPDSYGRKGSLLIVIIISTIIAIPLLLLSKVPYIYNYPFNITADNAERQYKNSRRLILVMSAQIQAFFLYINIKSIYIAMNKSESLGFFSIIIFMFILFASLGYYTWKMYKLK